MNYYTILKILLKGTLSFFNKFCTYLRRYDHLRTLTFTRGSAHVKFGLSQIQRENLTYRHRIKILTFTVFEEFLL